MKTSILGIGVTINTRKNVLEYVVSMAQKRTKKCFIVTPNPEMVVASHKDHQLRALLNNADLALCDGVGLYLASYFVAKRVPQRITGVDFMKNLCENVSKKPITVGFLGGRGKVAEKTAECLVSEYPGLNVVFVNDEWKEEGFNLKKRGKKREVGEKNTREIAAHDSSLKNDNAHIDILFVAFGFPKQERWISENLDKIPVTVAMGVGGAFDFISGEVSRAPFLVRAIGLEWLYRLVRQPWRGKRQLALLKFIGLVLKSLVSSKK